MNVTVGVLVGVLVGGGVPVNVSVGDGVFVGVSVGGGSVGIGDRVGVSVKLMTGVGDAILAEFKEKKPSH